MALWTLYLLAAVLLLLAGIFIWQINSAYQRISAGSQLLETSLDMIEYTQGGTGTPVLVIHGSGGGYDQGELLARAVLGEDFHWISPSRFGYLRSSMPEEASFDAQAHAYALLLDHLGHDKVAVVALSHGGPSALLFAALYPERVSALVLISCGVASSNAPDQLAANRLGNALTSVYSHDVLYWGISTLFRRLLLRLLGADPGLMATLNPEQRLLADQLIKFMNPVKPRSAGVVFDNTAELPNERIAAIRAPTLIFHASDDGLQRFDNAEYAAAMIKGAILRRYEQGGHLLLAAELDSIRTQSRQFITAASAISSFQ